jgi:hypothetical protein
MPKEFPNYEVYHSTSCVFSSVLNEQEPPCFTQAMSRPEWRGNKYRRVLNDLSIL